MIINKDDRAIADTLEALAEIGSGPMGWTETIVVDASAGRLDDIAQRFPDVLWVPFTPRPDKPTIPEQRNVGINASRGDVVVFIDASCVPDPGWLERLLAPLIEREETVVAGGNRSLGGPGLRDEAMAFRGPGAYIEEAPTINLAVARSVFRAVGEFDETLRYGSDVDFTWRCVDAGHRIRHVPEAMVGHDWGDRRSELRRSYVYGQARLRLYVKHPGRRRFALKRDPTMVVYPVFLLALPLGLRWRWIPALAAIPLLKNVRHRPVLTVVDHLVYGAGVLTAAGRDALTRVR